MKRSLHIINGLSIMVLSLVGITLIVTTHFVDAQTATKQALQPKIATIKTLYKSPRGQTSKIFTWPSQAGKVVELDNTTTHIQITPAVQKGTTPRTYWAFRYVWSDEKPDAATLLSDAKTIAEVFFKATSFKTSATSPPVAIDAARNHGKFLTLYAFATNKDRTVGAARFPYGIDYTAAITYHVPDAIEQAPEEQPQDVNVDPIKPTPVSAPENDDWSQIKTTVPGYKE